MDHPGCLECDTITILTRGLCQKHYKMARTAVARGQASWAQLEAEGKARPPKSSTVCLWWQRGLASGRNSPVSFRGRVSG